MLFNFHTSSEMTKVDSILNGAKEKKLQNAIHLQAKHPSK